MERIPMFPEFKILELRDRQEIETITSQLPPYSDFHFPIMWIWDIHDPIKLSILNENLVVVQSDCVTAKPYYSVVGNTEMPKTIQQICNYIKANNIVTALKWMPEETFQLANVKGHYYFFRQDEDSYDYVYDVAKINAANGSEFSTLRRKINQFLKDNSNFEIKSVDFTQTDTLCVMCQAFPTFKVFDCSYTLLHAFFKFESL